MKTIEELKNKLQGHIIVSERFGKSTQISVDIIEPYFEMSGNFDSTIPTYSITDMSTKKVITLSEPVLVDLIEKGVVNNSRFAKYFLQNT